MKVRTILDRHIMLGIAMLDYRTRVQHLRGSEVIVVLTANHRRVRAVLTRLLLHQLFDL